MMIEWSGSSTLRASPTGSRHGAPVVIESQFPHLYGEIDPQAVERVRPYRPRADGTFDPLS